MLTGLAILTAASPSLGGFATSYPVLLASCARWKASACSWQRCPHRGLLAPSGDRPPGDPGAGVWGAYIPFGTGHGLPHRPVGHPARHVVAVVVAAGGASRRSALAAVCLRRPPGSAPCARRTRAARAVTRPGTACGCTLGSVGPWTAALGLRGVCRAVDGRHRLPPHPYMPRPAGRAPSVPTPHQRRARGSTSSATSWLACCCTGAGGWSVCSVWASPVRPSGPCWRSRQVTESAPVVRGSPARSSSRWSVVWCLARSSPVAPLFAPDEGTISTTIGLIQQLSSAGQVIGPPVVACAGQRRGRLPPGPGWHAWPVAAFAGAALSLVLDHRTRPHT
jgi:hypothetical protein